jgi:putative SOS response-associated peptidase YedK
VRSLPVVFKAAIFIFAGILKAVCGRYALTQNESELIEDFAITGISPNVDPLPANWNIKPTEEIYIIRNFESERELAKTSWGIIAPWSKSEVEALRSQSQAINARSESIHEKPTFRSAFRARRCLIPATGYYEWATEFGKYKTKQPVFISNESGKPLAFAGIYEKWISPTGEIKESAAIITREAVAGLAEVHHRMPVFLPRDRWDHWLDKKNNDIAKVRSLMEVSEPAVGLRFWPVSDAVNSIRNNGAELVKEIELGEPETLF